jgi:hypothetical protein
LNRIGKIGRRKEYAFNFLIAFDSKKYFGWLEERVNAVSERDRRKIEEKRAYNRISLTSISFMRCDGYMMRIDFNETT